MSPKLLVVLAGTAALLASCGSDTDGPPLVGRGHSSGEGDSLYQQAKQADDAGDTNKALKLYGEAAERYPLAQNSAQARYRQAQLLDQKGDVQKAFDAYQGFIERYNGSGLYSSALNRQAAIAQSAADGKIQTNFLGLKSNLSDDKIEKMLTKVILNAPKSAVASRAQFTIGELRQKGHDAKQSIEAYRKVVRDYPDSREAPEAQFRVGKVLVEQAERGNQNQANLELAREAFQDYLSQYPGHSRNAEARKLISELGGRDVQRTFDVAEFYLKTGEKESAKVYYRDVARRSGSGSLHDKAKARLAELGER